MRKVIFALLFITVLTPCRGQEIKSVEGEYTYYAPSNISLDEAKKIALERAQLEAIAEVFGTVISQENITTIKNNESMSKTDFASFSSSDVKGEWLKTTKKPEFDISFSDSGIIVKVKVKGEAREIISANYEVSAKILRRIPNLDNESSDFIDGDNLYIQFQSPVDGFLAVYLIDEDNNAFCILPYRNQRDGVFKVQANKPYMLFSRTLADPDVRYVVDEYEMACSRSCEINQICIIFSPNLFYKPNDIDNGNLVPRELRESDFQKWVAKIRRKDNLLIYQNKKITVKNK